MPVVSTKPAYLDHDGASRYLSLSVNTFDRLVARGAIPKPRQLAEKRVGWLVRELDEWSEKRPVSSALPPGKEVQAA